MSSQTHLRQLLEPANKTKTAIVYRGKPFTYDWLNTLSRELAGGLSTVLQKGQTLALWLPNCPELIALYLACLRCGVVPVPLRSEIREQELTRILEATDCRVLISSADQMSRVSTDFYSHLKQVFAIDTESLHPQIEPWSTLFKGENSGPLVIADKISPAFIMATSGSEGRPKAVMLSAENLEHILACRIRVAGLDSNSTVVTGSCLTQSVGLHQVLAMLAAGGLIVLFEDYNIAHLVDAVNRHKPTHLIMVVHAFSQLLNHPNITRGSFENIRFASLGADRVTASAQAKYKDLTSVPLTVTYGLTESSWALVNDSGRWDKALSIGKPADNAQVRLVNESGDELGSDLVGEIQIKSPRTMLGYLDEPQMTDEVLIDGWLSSGDYAYRDDDGFYWFAGRKKNQIVLNTGDTVSPVEIEHVLSEYCEVLDCMVTSGQCEQDKSEVPIAYIVPQGESLTAEALNKHLDKHLSPYKHPREFRFVPALPIGETGKVLRN